MESSEASILRTVFNRSQRLIRLACDITASVTLLPACPLIINIIDQGQLGTAQLYAAGCYGMVV